MVVASTLSAMASNLRVMASLFFYILVVSDERRVLVTQALQNGSKSWRSSRPPIFQLLD